MFEQPIAQHNTQNIYGGQNAITWGSGDATIVNVYKYAVPGPIDPNTLVAAQRCLDELPLDVVPVPRPVPTGSSIRFSHNPEFVGRRVDLRAVARALKVADSSEQVQVAAVTGLGGIGKTQLASEFVHRYGHYFSGGIFWLSFTDAATIPAQVAACGRVGYLDLRPDFDKLSLNDQVRLVLSAWQSELPRLLVFDTCEDQELLLRWRPPTGACRVLITSRRSNWNIVSGVIARPLGMLHRIESIELLQKHRHDLPTDDADLEAIAGELDDLPLALHLAGSYLERYYHVLTPANYLKRLRESKVFQDSSLQSGGWSPTEHNQHVAQTFAISYQQLHDDDPIDAHALALLARASYCAPSMPIPPDLLLATLSTAESDISPTLQYGDALNKLMALGLLETGSDGMLRMHRLLAMFVQSMTKDTEARVAVVQTLLTTVQRLEDFGQLAPLLTLQPHLRAIIDENPGRKDEQTAALCAELGSLLTVLGNHALARTYLERALVIQESILSPDHPDVAVSLRYMARLLVMLGEYIEARPLYERALAIMRVALGPEHPGTAVCMESLADLLATLAEYAEARPLYERALAINEAALGPMHPHVANSLNNLADLLATLAEYAEARPLYERALAIMRVALGPEHPGTAVCMESLADLLVHLGLNKSAIQCKERQWARMRLGGTPRGTDMRARPITLTVEEREDLERLTRRHRAPQQVVTRARIVLAAGDRHSIIGTADDLGLNRDTVRLWRDRWTAVQDIPLADLDVAERLADAPRPGAPTRITAEQVCQVVALACEAPTTAGRPISQWTNQELADEIMRRGIVDTISPRHAARVVKRGT